MKYKIVYAIGTWIVNSHNLKVFQITYNAKCTIYDKDYYDYHNAYTTDETSIPTLGDVVDGDMDGIFWPEHWYASPNDIEEAMLP